MAKNHASEKPVINEGDLIQVDTRDGSYLQRVKE